MTGRMEMALLYHSGLTERIAEARDRVWLGEATGLQKTLVALRTKTQHAERLAAAGITDTPEPLT